MKKAYLSIAALLSALALAACAPNEADSSQGGSSSSPAQSQTSTETTSSSKEDVITYSLSVSTPAKTTFDVGETLSFNAIDVKLTTFKNNVKDSEVTLERNEYSVKVKDQTVENDFVFSEAGEFTFVIASVAHPDVTNNNLKLTAVALYTLTNASSDKVVLANLPEKAHAGDTVSFSLNLLPGFYFEGTLLVADANGDAVQCTVDGYDYTFTMPAGNVTITVTADLNDFTISRDTEVIDAIKSEDDKKTDVFSAVPGTQLKFAVLENIDWIYDKVYVDGNEVTKGEDNYYHFTMPTHPVKISTNKAHKNYAITTNAADLTLTTTNMYIDTEAKTAVTEAYKGQVVYLKLTYEVSLVKYTVTAKDGKKNTIEVTAVEGEDNLYSFTMISSEITVTIAEEDWSKYYGYYVTNKEWKAKEFWGSTDSLNTYTQTNFTSLSYVFNSNGKGLRGTIEITWETADAADATSGHLTRKYNSYTNDVYYTPNMLVTKYSDYANGKWNDAYLGTWNPDVTIHVFIFDSTSRLFWIQDADGNITEKILINDENVYTSFNLYTDAAHTILATGADITMTSTFYVSISDTNYFEVSKHEIVKTYSLAYTSDDSVKNKFTLKYKNENGEEITSAKNGEKIYIYLELTEAGAGLDFKEPTVKYDTSSVTLTAGEDDNSYYFTMPKGNVTTTITLSDPNKYLGHAAVGNYYGYEIEYSSSNNKHGDHDFSTYDTNIRTYQFAASGDFTESYTYYGSSYNNAYTVSDVSSGNRGTFKAGNYTYRYGGDVIARSYYADGSSSWKTSDAFIAYKLPDGKTKDNLKVRTHWNGASYSPTSYAVEWLLDDVVAAGLFAYNNEFYCGVTFEMTDGERISSTSTYNVKQDGETIFTVTKGTVTAAE